MATLVRLNPGLRESLLGPLRDIDVLYRLDVFLSRREPRAEAYRRLSQWMRTQPHHA